MPDTPEPNGYELQRGIERVETNLHQGLTDLKVLIAGLVSRDLFDYESKAQNERIEKVETALRDYQDREDARKARFWIQVFLPVLALVVSIALAFLV